LKEFRLTTMVPLLAWGRRSVDRSNVDQQRPGRIEIRTNR
jgi:hypothetical protein